MRLVDSHVHLDRYSDDQIQAMVSRATAAGVAHLLTIGVDVASSRSAVEIAGRYEAVLAAVGVHPTRVAGLTSPPAGDPSPPAPLTHARERGSHGGAIGPEEWMRRLLGEGEAARAAGRLVAIGEVGLDEGAPDLAAQERFLAGCASLAVERDLPLVLHVVGREEIHARALEIVQAQGKARAVAHYFVGGPELAARYLEAGCWISVGRPATRPTEVAVRLAVPTIPLDRLLLETDTYPLPGRTTEPKDVATVCAAVAEITGREYAEVAAATTASFAAFLGRTVAMHDADGRLPTG